MVLRADTPTGPHLELAKSLILLGQGFPWKKADPGPSGEPKWWWAWWNLAFVQAAGSMLRAMVTLTEGGVTREADLQLRALLELVGNQYYMRADTNRAIEFAVAGIEGRADILQKLQEYGLGGPDQIQEIARGIARDERLLAKYTAELPGRTSRDQRPFARSAKTRIESAGLNWHYDLIYRTTSDLIHMGPRAVALYLDESLSGDIEAHIVTGNELMLRVLYAADEALDQGYRDALDGYAIEYGKRAFPERDPGDVKNYLRPK